MFQRLLICIFGCTGFEHVMFLFHRCDYVMFSSPEHNMPMVSFSGRPMSFVRLVLCHIDISFK